MSGKAYPRPTYLPPLSIFNPAFFPQVFPTTSSSGGGGGGSNNFPSGILSGNTISYYATSGADRDLYGVSLLEFSDSTTIDYTDITTTMELTGGTFTIENTNTSSVINFVADSVEVNGVAIATGGNVSNNQNNTFQSGFTQKFEGAVEINNTTLSFPSGGTIILGNTTSVLDFPEPLPVVPNSNSGLGITWNNQTGSNGEVDFLCYGQGGSGGFAFYTMNSTTTPTRIATIYQNTSSFTSNPTIPTSTTIGTLTASQTATTYLLNSTYAPLFSPTLTGTPLSTTPPINDNSTKIATTAFVQSAINSNVLFTITTSAGSGTSPPATWTFTLPNSTYPQQFLYYAYLNLQSGAGTTISAPAYAVGTSVVTSNSNTIFGYGQAVYTTWNTNTAINPIIAGYGYVFNTISSIGSTNFSINTISQANNSTGTTTYNLVCDSLNGATFTIVGVAVP